MSAIAGGANSPPLYFRFRGKAGAREGGRFRPRLARSGSSPRSKSRQLKGWNRPVWDVRATNP